MKIFFPNSCGLTRLLFFSFLFFASISHAQVGIGNTNPNVSSMLDITSTSKGILAPRMTTGQRTAITTPANSLLVYDTDLKAFYYYETTTSTWIKINSSAEKRNNFKIIKTVADLAPELAAGGGTRYLLDENFFYEINGTITLAFPIALNDAYLGGMDASEDILTRASGPVFEGTKGGSIRNVTITGGGTAFNITGVATTSLLVQNTVISGMGSVGTISGLGLYFSNIVQYLGNGAGITYNNIGSLLLSNQAWFSGNIGVYEKFTGTFAQIQKVSGFSTVNGTNTAIDVSSNPTVGQAVLLSTVFSGTGTYVNRYTGGSYTGYNFDNNWYVNCPGIPVETDFAATGDIYFNTTGTSTTFTGTNPIRVKVAGTTDSNNLFRFVKVGSNRIDYKGKKTRYFQVSSSLSFEQTNLATFIFYIAVNGAVVQQSKVYTRPDTASGLFVLADAGIQTAPIVATLSLNTNDYVEIWVERLIGTGSINTVSLNLSIR